MLDLTRYPKLNDSPHERPVLASTGKAVLGELLWFVIPAAVIGLASLLR